MGVKSGPVVEAVKRAIQSQIDAQWLLYLQLPEGSAPAAYKSVFAGHRRAMFKDQNITNKGESGHPLPFMSLGGPVA